MALRDPGQFPDAESQIRGRHRAWHWHCWKGLAEASDHCSTGSCPGSRAVSWAQHQEPHPKGRAGTEPGTASAGKGWQRQRGWHSCVAFRAA